MGPGVLVQGMCPRVDARKEFKEFKHQGIQKEFIHTLLALGRLEATIGKTMVDERRHVAARDKRAAAKLR